MNPNHSEEEKLETMKVLKKRRMIYVIIALCGYPVGVGLGFGIGAFTNTTVSIIILAVAAVIWGVAAGFAALCNNQYAFVASDGKKEGGGITSILLCLLGLILIPYGTVMLCAKFRPLSELVMGVKFEDE